MIRGQWRNPVAGVDQSYGLGIVSGSLGSWDWFGHSGGLQGYISRACVMPRQELTGHQSRQPRRTGPLRSAKSGNIVEIWLAATKLLPGPKLAGELRARYGDGVANFTGPSPASSSTSQHGSVGIDENFIALNARNQRADLVREAGRLGAV
jgi:hypothetical protein